MTDRDRLKELLKQANTLYLDYLENIDQKGLIDTEGKAKFFADYLIANGVIVPPCKVGDIIYQTDGVRIYASTIHEITYTSSKVIFVTENIDFDEQAINNSIFLTREEAEKALERSKGNA